MLPGEDLVGPTLAGTFKDLPDINVVRHGGKLLALGESCNPFLMSSDLATIGRETFGDTLPIGITAHPKIDPRTGEMVAFCYNIDAPYLTWSVIDRDGSTVRAATPVDGIDQPSMIHDMALTDTYVVLVVGPLYFDLMAAMSGGSLMSWQPDHGTRIALIAREDGATTWLSTEAFWMWHTANAHDEVLPDGGVEVVLDYVRWDAPGGLVPGVHTTGSLARVRLNPRTGGVTHETLVDQNMEFPRVDDRALTTNHRIIGTSLKTGPRRAAQRGCRLTRLVRHAHRNLRRVVRRFARGGGADVRAPPGRPRSDPRLVGRLRHRPNRHDQQTPHHRRSGPEGRPGRHRAPSTPCPTRPPRRVVAHRGIAEDLVMDSVEDIRYGTSEPVPDAEGAAQRLQEGTSSPVVEEARRFGYVPLRELTGVGSELGPLWPTQHRQWCEDLGLNSERTRTTRN